MSYGYVAICVHMYMHRHREAGSFLILSLNRAGLPCTRVACRWTVKLPLQGEHHRSLCVGTCDALLYVAVLPCLCWQLSKHIAVLIMPSHRHVDMWLSFANDTTLLLGHYKEEQASDKCSTLGAD